jgi:hypothetical protein
MNRFIAVLALCAIAHAQYQPQYAARTPARIVAAPAYGQPAERLVAAPAYAPAPAAPIVAAPAYGPARVVAAEPVYAPQPYNFGYNVDDGYGNSNYQNEEGDTYGNKKGSYGYTDAYGVYRQVDYVADENGFRATIRTNEPGVDNKDPASAQIQASAPPAQVAVAKLAAAPIVAAPQYAPAPARIVAAEPAYAPAPQRLVAAPAYAPAPARLVAAPQYAPAPARIVAAPQYAPAPARLVAAPAYAPARLQAVPEYLEAPPPPPARIVAAEPQYAPARVVAAEPLIAAEPQYESRPYKRRARAARKAFSAAYHGEPSEAESSEVVYADQ